MQPGSSYPNRENNTYATSEESIDFDQRSVITLGDAPPYIPGSFEPITSDASVPYESGNLFHSNPMGQGASTPCNEPSRQNHGLHQGETAAEGVGASSVAGDLESAAARAAAASARLRRSRRIRNHIEHFARLGNRLMPSSASSSSPALPTSSISSPAGSSNSRVRINPGVPGLRFRARGFRLSGMTRSTTPPTSRPGHRSMPPGASDNTHHHHNVVGGEPMDISPVSTVTPQNLHESHSQHQSPNLEHQNPENQNQGASVNVGASATPSRRSRMSRVRDSISAWPNHLSSELGSMLSRPSSRRPSETRAGALDALNGNSRDATGLETPSETASTANPAPAASATEEPSRPDRSSIFGEPRNGQSIFDTLQNPGRIRPGEDQAAMLSRLLSVAAAATAASLVGDAEEAITQAQDVGGDNGGDGSFESFLRALRNGRLEAALRNGGNEMGGGNNAADPNGENGVLSLNFFRMFRFGSTPASNRDEDVEEGGQGGGRMVPVIIVGIRSVSPRESTEGEGNRPAPFFDALANLSMPRRPRLGSGGSSGAGSPRRPTSMGSPFSTARPNSNIDPNLDLPQPQASENRDRNGTAAGPSRPAPVAPEGTRSWIIYVLGGSYPENHPILTTPSLFTDEPTYEDMTLLSSLLGPAKLPVAAKEDLDSAGGIFTYGEESATQYGPGNADRCLICLSDYEMGHECRKIVKCNHIFHRECIDEWLTTGRNSCPLCRGEGVEEKSKAADPAAPALASSAPETAATAAAH